MISKNLSHFISQAIKEEGKALLLSSGDLPRVLIAQQWEILSSNILSKESVNELCMSLLKEDQKKDFLLNKQIIYSLQSESNYNLKIHIYEKNEGLVGLFQIFKKEALDPQALELPSFVTDLALLPRGLVVWSGSPQSGKTTSVVSLLEKINQVKNLHIVYLEDTLSYSLNSKKSSISSIELSDKNKNSWMESSSYKMAQVYVFDAGLSRTQIDIAFHLSQERKLVFLLFNEHNCVSAIKRMASFYKAQEQDYFYYNMHQALHSVVHQELLPALEKIEVPAFEILNNNSEMRNLIRSGQIEKIEELSHHNTENSSFKSLNQNLFNLILKRKIKISTAFEWSEKPEELDRILKIAGL